jgi:tetratricopeptide (TPR) repeat protein
MKRLIVYSTIALAISASTVRAQTIDPDSATLALKTLKNTQAELLQKSTATGPAQVALIDKMLKLGLWDKAIQLINAGSPTSADYKLLKADYLILHNEFKAAELLVNGVLLKQPANEKAVRLKAYLQIQAWRLPQAIATAKKSLAKNPNQEETELVMGRALLLQKKYPQALAIAKKAEAKNPNNAGAYLLEADVYFWDQHPEQAEAPLKKSLSIDPYNADARFSYGYAIWRRVDATQLNAMAAQWEIALAVNPLHFSTNWHWGNGHTNLTYADYAEKNDEEVRKALAPADSLFSANKINEAIAFTRVIQKKYPNSVLPLMHRGSLYYSAFDTDRKLRLDSAENIFRQILFRKKHYGPAHNGLSAVIKSKRIPYLSIYDSITHVLKTLKIADQKNFEKVFPDVAYYPGGMAKAMAYNQLYAATVYFPFLSKMGNVFRVSPLHIDLAITMRQPSFRYTTTFDNRQWMDIRGVGSGAADIEYVERGAYEERNVILHEYTHLYHGSVFTDDESRQVRAHYYKAMAEHRTLDYYSQNNESEYLAQTYPAYFEPVKVHPLDFKSMNTRADLIAKDPSMYDFIDKLVKRQRAYLAGDKSAMASNWAQVYLNLSNRGRRSGLDKMAAYLDTALIYDGKYLPAYLAYSRIKSEQKDFAAAAQWLQKAETVNANYAPIYVAHADLVKAQYNAKLIDQPTAVKQQADYLNKATRLEDDYQELAANNIQLRETYRRNGQIADAIATAEDYAKNGATVSTYLRDRRDDAAAYVASLKSELGYPEPVAVLQHLVEQKPQNFEYRTMYANALAANKLYDKAIATLQQAQRILKASGNGRPGFDLQIAEFYNYLGQKDSVVKYQPTSAPVLAQQGQGGRNRNTASNEDGLRYVRLLAATGKVTEAAALLKTFPPTDDNAYLSEYNYTQGKIQEATQPELAAASYETAIKYDPYFFKVYPWLISYYNKNGQAGKSEALKSNLKALKIQPGTSLNME